MALKRIGLEESSSYEVPWIKDFYLAGGEIGDSSFVESIKKTEKGYLILCQEFKGFLFGNSSITKYLEEALKVWTSSSNQSFPLYAIAEKGGKISLAIDDTESATNWLMTAKDSSWEQRRKKEVESSSISEQSNPFLLTPPPTSNGKRTRSKDMPSTPSAMS
jgi:hypothetical protein